MCFELFFRKTELNTNYFKINMEYCYIIISENFVKPFGIYDDLKLAREEYNKLTVRHVNASIYKVEVNNNIVDKKNCYTLICNNNLTYL
jgi:hypothetical protein